MGGTGHYRVLHTGSEVMHLTNGRVVAIVPVSVSGVVAIGKEFENSESLAEHIPTLLYARKQIDVCVWKMKIVPSNTRIKEPVCEWDDETYNVARLLPDCVHNSAVSLKYLARGVAGAEGLESTLNLYLRDEDKDVVEFLQQDIAEIKSDAAYDDRLSGRITLRDLVIRAESLLDKMVAKRAHEGTDGMLPAVVFEFAGTPVPSVLGNPELSYEAGLAVLVSVVDVIGKLTFMAKDVDSRPYTYEFPTELDMWCVEKGGKIRTVNCRNAVWKTFVLVSGLEDVLKSVHYTDKGMRLLKNEVLGYTKRAPLINEPFLFVSLSEILVRHKKHVCADCAASILENVKEIVGLCDDKKKAANAIRTSLKTKFT